MVPYQQTFPKHQKVKFYYIHTKRKKIQYQQCLNTSRWKQNCTLLWENSYCTNLNKLRILQKKAIRIITNSHYIAHTDPLFSKLKQLKLDDIYKHQLGIFMYKAANNKLPDSMSSMLTRIQNIHKHNLRNQNSYYIQNIRTNSRKCTINYSGPVFWNALPSKLKQLVSINQFKNKLKELLLSKYQ